MKPPSYSLGHCVPSNFFGLSSSRTPCPMLCTLLTLCFLPSLVHHSVPCRNPRLCCPFPTTFTLLAFFLRGFLFTVSSPVVSHSTYSPFLPAPSSALSRPGPFILFPYLFGLSLGDPISPSTSPLTPSCFCAPPPSRSSYLRPRPSPL